MAVEINSPCASTTFSSNSVKMVFGVRTDIVEMRFDKFQTFLLIFGSGIKFINVLAIFRFQSVDNLVSTFRILLVQIVRNLNQCVCGTDMAERTTILRSPSVINFGHFLNSLSRTY